MEWFLMPTVEFEQQAGGEGERWKPKGLVEEIERWDGMDSRTRFAGLIAILGLVLR